MNEIDFAKGNGLVPVIIQDMLTDKVLMLGYMNEEALKQTLSSKKVTFFSRSKNRLWTKGETSGNYLVYHNHEIDCDRDTLLMKVNPNGPVCHQGHDTCFREPNQQSFDISKLYEIIESRKEAKPESSYTALLFNKGVNKITQKVGEESVEVVIEAIAQNNPKLKEEVADLLYHLTVLLAHKNISIEEIYQVLAARHKS